MSSSLPSLLLPNIHENNQNFSQEKLHYSLSSKVVEFDLPPIKRQKVDGRLMAESVISKIQNSVEQIDRQNALSVACTIFDHRVETVHDEEISAGADAALCKHLAFLLLKNREVIGTPDVIQIDSSDMGSLQSDTSSVHQGQTLKREISTTLLAIEMILRCSSNSVLNSFYRVGSELTSILIHIIKAEMSHKRNPTKENVGSVKKLQIDGYGSVDSNLTQSTTSSFENTRKSQHDSFQYANLCLNSCTKVMAHFARPGAATGPLALTKDFLSTLVDIISASQHIVPVEAKLNSLWTLANLACNPENMGFMACCPALVDNIILVIDHPKHRIDENNKDNYLGLLRSRSVALRAILNLSWASENKILFSENDDIVSALLKSASHQTCSWEGDVQLVDEILLQSRRHATGALRNIAAAPRRNKRYLCRYQRFLNTLAGIAGSDSDSYVKERAHETLFNLVCADTANLYTKNNDVLNVISEAAFSNTDNGVKSSYSVVALRTLRTLEKAIPEEEEGYKILQLAINKRDV